MKESDSLFPIENHRKAFLPPKLLFDNEQEHVEF